jgi:hypothetical protein
MEKGWQMTLARPPSGKSPWRRYAFHLVAVAVLSLVFWFYTQPAFLVMLADQLWSCF